MGKNTHATQPASTSSWLPSRRGILRSALWGGAASAAVAAAPFVRARPLRSRLKLAAIGAANRGAANIAGVLDHDVALLCDVDAQHLARGVAQVTGAGQPDPRGVVDWRELLAGDHDLQGVVISTPDHTHAAIARAALRRGLPVYCEKPLSRTVGEVRQLRDLARKHAVPTQMGTQIHATDNYRRVVEAVRSGAIGDVHRVDVICSKSWSAGKFGEAAPAPEHLAWNLWLGPTPYREYCEGVHPANWRRFWQFGTGTVGDMACHWVDLVHWALELGVPHTVESEGGADSTEPDAVGTPRSLHVRWGHPAKIGPDGTQLRAPVDVHWYDGGAQPEFAPLPDCHVFHGAKGRIVSTYGSMEVQLSDESVWTPPERTIQPSPGHYVEWTRAIEGRSAPKPLCSFDYATDLTETVLLATVAYRAGGRMTWDAATGTASKGQEFVAIEERDGWDV